MKILVLAKRQYMGKDLLIDQFGRFRELPLCLSEFGHEVTGVALSYRRKEEAIVLDADSFRPGRVMWHSLNLTPGLTPRVFRYSNRTTQLARELGPDVIWAGSDAYHVIFGTWLAKHIGVRCVVDLYDNFEAFTASKLPFVLRLFRRAVKQADGVSCFSNRLATHVVHSYSCSRPTVVIENGVRQDFFDNRNQRECRRQLNLPENATIIGTAGALDRSRGVDALFKAYDLLSPRLNNLHLAIAGPRAPGARIPRGARVHDFGILPHQAVPLFINALDLAVICYRRSAQGEFSFPQKAYEIMACRVPLIAAAVGCMNELLSDYPECLYEPEDPQSLANAAFLQLKKRITVATKVPSWADSARQLEYFFEKILQRDTATPRTHPTHSIAR